MKRITAILLSTALICSSAAGCSDSSSSEAKSSAAEVTTTVTEAVTSQTEKPAETSTASAKFNYDEAVKSVTFFGNEISSSVTLNDLGDDFTIDTEYTEVMTNTYACSMYYKGSYLGQAQYKTDKPDTISRDTSLAGVSILGKKNDDFGVTLIAVNGIGLGDKRDRVTAEFGVCPFEGKSSDMYLERTEQQREINFTYSSPDYDTISGIDIIWK